MLDTVFAADGGVGAVDGDITGGLGQGEGQVLHGAVQHQVQIQYHPASAVGIDGDVAVGGGGAALGRYGGSQSGQKQYHEKKADKLFHIGPPFKIRENILTRRKGKCNGKCDRKASPTKDRPGGRSLHKGVDRHRGVFAGC